MSGLTRSGYAYVAAAAPIPIGDFISEGLLQALRQLNVFDVRADFFPDDRFEVLAFPKGDLRRTWSFWFLGHLSHLNGLALDELVRGTDYSSLKQSIGPVKPNLAALGTSKRPAGSGRAGLAPRAPSPPHGGPRASRRTGF